MATIRIVVSKVAEKEAADFRAEEKVPADLGAAEGIRPKNQNLHELASQLRAKGMKIDTIMEAIGVITGEIAERDLPALQALPGVTVEREGSVQLNPPDAPVQ